MAYPSLLKWHGQGVGFGFSFVASLHLA